jgi:NADPH:quinone reductase-like Zn-dependent oxidoreductase
VAEYGAEKAWDYHDANVVAAIKAYTEDGLEYALDCVCDAASMEFCYRVLGRAGGRYTTLEPYPDSLSIIQTRKRRVKPEWIMGPALLGKKIGWKPPYDIDPDPELRVFGKEWFLCAQQLLDRGEIKPHPVRIGEKQGFGAVLDGLEILKAKAVSGQKLVYYVGDAEEPR